MSSTSEPNTLSSALSEAGFRAPSDVEDEAHGWGDLDIDIDNEEVGLQEDASTHGACDTGGEKVNCHGRAKASDLFLFRHPEERLFIPKTQAALPCTSDMLQVWFVREERGCVLLFIHCCHLGTRKCAIASR